MAGMLGRVRGASTRAVATVTGMLVYVIAIVVAILIVPLTGGQFRAARRRIRLRSRLAARSPGSALQILLEVIDLPRARYDDVGLAILLASYVLIIGFGALEPADSPAWA